MHGTPKIEWGGGGGGKRGYPNAKPGDENRDLAGMLEDYFLPSLKYILYNRVLIFLI